ncbi:hypothetical protein L6164_012331 [Bauhinia variegata]|uniref:Uncharacterized protein n=1 Tax=Bauhinia variegata TaxID=167791 RepID=A0ACB9P9R5_BAUVA|nr:hypothetical protein L6164_012331 [Bauhinia variegata]
MFDFGDEVSLESYRIPWLIWIQLLVLLLLIALLYCFSIFASDPSPADDTSATAANASSSTGRRLIFDDIQQIEKPVPKHDSPARVIINRRQNTQGGENTSIKGEISTSASRRIVSCEEFTEGQEESSSVCFHPCHYFKLARLALLKCLGLDPTSDGPSTRKHRKRTGS